MSIKNIIHELLTCASDDTCESCEYAALTEEKNCVNALLKRAAEVITDQQNQIEQLKRINLQSDNIQTVIDDMEVIFEDFLNKISVIDPIVHVFKSEIKFLRSKYETKKVDYEQLKFPQTT